ncbi:MAG: hypothetical protein K6C10_02715 [Prevotella sp.]|nr:hypothetical protein [Prevotella sp.]
MLKKLLVIPLLLFVLTANAQTFSMETVNDSVSYLVLTTDSTTDRWQLPYPVYQFQVGDVNGNGSEEAMVGVIKKTRFHRDFGRRLFIFKNYNGLIRPLWMGSKLGGHLEDFRFIESRGTRNDEGGARNEGCGTIRALETGKDGTYTISDYRWEGFGMVFDHFIEKKINQKDKAYEKFHLDRTDTASEHQR